MKNLIFLFLIIASPGVAAQDSEKMEVQKTIQEFFEGFHKQDSLKIKTTVSNNIVMQTIAMNESGNNEVKTQGFSDFLKRIVGIPKTTKFEEIIKDYSIQIDGPMANAWTPYEFKIDDSFHHCGVNSFQLVKDSEKGWQIVYIIDTRRKESCDRKID